MRLRPSGRSGPVATSLDAFASYQETEAWTWEHMALTRARVVSGVAGIRGQGRGVIRKVLGRKRDVRVIAGDVADMRRAIADEKGEGTRWDMKYAAGGLVDLEFIAQYLQLVHAADHPEILDHLDRARSRQGATARRAAAPEDADVLRPAARALSQHHANPAAVPARAVRSEDRWSGAARPCWRGRPTCRISPRWMRTWRRRRRKVRASFERDHGRGAGRIKGRALSFGPESRAIPPKVHNGHCGAIEVGPILITATSSRTRLP